MMLNEIAANKDLSNLLCVGIKDKHYTVISEDAALGVIEVDVPADSKYNHGVFWELTDGNHVNFAPKGAALNLTQQKLDFNAAAELSPFLGFVMNSDSLASEKANCQSVLDEYLPYLTTGSVDIDTKLSEFIQKLKAAGADAIVAETQKQLDAWKATNK